LSAPARHSAAESEVLPNRARAVELWHRAAAIRPEWLACGLSAEPADRPAAERAIAGIYARLSRPRPGFVWVDSPRQALTRVADVAGLSTLDDLYRWVNGRRPLGDPPLASDLAADRSVLRGALDGCLPTPDPNPPPPKAKSRKEKKEHPPRPVLPPLQALEFGVPLREVLHQGIREALRTSLADGFYHPVRAALAEHPQTLPVCWYGQQESWWVGYHDVVRRIGLARYPAPEARHLADWVAIVRSCGWWWPGEDTCVVVERPIAVRTEPVPGSWHGEVRLRSGAGPAVEYRDGWRVPVGGPATSGVDSRQRLVEVGR
jgi:hypothetical protein